MSIDIMEPGFDEDVDLAPGIYRQRLVIEGLVDEPIGPERIEAYLSELSECLDMRTVLAPITHESEQFGWAGWIHWETSGAHFYAWERPTLFFSVDIYTCKWFAAERAVAFTRDYFHPRALQSREF
jgi:S-adenosylmethionine decarboxylase